MKESLIDLLNKSTSSNITKYILLKYLKQYDTLEGSTKNNDLLNMYILLE